MSEQARKVVNAIITDLSDRSGLGDEWDQIDDDVQQEIRAQWEHLIDGALTPASDSP